MAELVTLSAADAQTLPPSCPCCLVEIGAEDAGDGGMPACKACRRHQKRGRLRLVAWILLAAAGVVAFSLVAPPRERLSAETKAVLPLMVLFIGVGAGALSRLVVPRSRHAAEGPALEVHAVTRDSMTLRVANPGYADRIVAKAPGSVRHRAPVNPANLLLGLPFGAAWAELGIPGMAGVHAAAVAVLSLGMVFLLWPRPGDEQALAALRRAPSLPGVQAFLKEYPASPLGSEALDLAWGCVATSRDRMQLRSYLSLPRVVPNRAEAQARLAELDLADLEAKPDWTRMARFVADNPDHVKCPEFRAKLADSLEAAESSDTPPVEIFREVLRGQSGGTLRVIVSGFANNGEHLSGVRQFVTERLKVHGVLPTFVEYGQPAAIVLVGAPSTVRYRGRDGGQAEGLRYRLQIDVKAAGGQEWTGTVDGDPPDTIYVRKGEEESAGRATQNAAYQSLMQKLWPGHLFTYPRAEAK